MSSTVQEISYYVHRTIDEGKFGYRGFVAMPLNRDHSFWYIEADFEAKDKMAEQNLPLDKNPYFAYGSKLAVKDHIDRVFGAIFQPETAEDEEFFEQLHERAKEVPKPTPKPKGSPMPKRERKASKAKAKAKTKASPPNWKPGSRAPMGSVQAAVRAIAERDGEIEIKAAVIEIWESGLSSNPSLDTGIYAILRDGPYVKVDNGIYRLNEAEPKQPEPKTPRRRGRDPVVAEAVRAIAERDGEVQLAALTAEIKSAGISSSDHLDTGICKILAAHPYERIRRGVYRLSEDALLEEQERLAAAE